MSVGRCVECEKDLEYQASWCPRCNYRLDVNGRRIGYAGKIEPDPAEEIVEISPEVTPL